LLFVSSPALASSDEEDTAEFETYTNSDYGFSIEYPSNWDAKESGLLEYEVVHFVSNDEPAVMKVVIGDKSQFGNMSIYEFMDRAIETSEGRLISKTNTTLMGLPAVEKISYKYPFGNTAKDIEVATFSGNDMISLSYITQPGTFDEYLPQFRHMVDSFKLGNE